MKLESSLGKLMMDAQPRQYVDTENQDLGRKVNDRNKRHTGPQPANKMWVVCECTDGDCEELIQITVDQYRQIRKGDSHFLVLVGHESRGLERIVARNGTWLTVQKTGEAKY